MLNASLRQMAVILSVIAGLSFGIGATSAVAQGGVQLSAVTVEGAPQIQEDLIFTLESLGGDSSFVSRVSGAAPSINLPEGRYLLTTSYQGFSVEEEITVGPETDRHVVNLNAGTIDLAIIPRVGAQPLTTPSEWRIMSFQKDYLGNREVLFEGVDDNPSLILPAGWYVVEAMSEGRRVKHTIDVAAGAVFSYKLVRQ